MRLRRFLPTVPALAGLLLPALLVLGRAALPTGDHAHAASATGAEPGPLLLVGGGSTLPVFRERVLETIGGPRHRILVVPQSSSREDAGAGSVEMWEESGALHVEILDHEDPRVGGGQIDAADLLWVPGGDQSRLTQVLGEAGLLDALRARHAAGAMYGGTSAGAAAAPDRMITGIETPERLEKGGTHLADGVGVWPGVFVDQHFLRRGRWNRFVEAVLSHPERLGVALGESTGVLVTGGAFEVIGAHNVIVLDARDAEVGETEEGAPPAATGLRLHVLRDGMRFEFEREER